MDETGTMRGELTTRELRHGSLERDVAARSVLLGRLFGEASASFGRYVLREQIGRGGFGVVYAAWDPELARLVAIKLLRAQDDARHDLLEEARIAGSLSHPNIVTVYDTGRCAAEGVFVVMELVDGENLTRWLRTPRSKGEILEVFVQAADALVAAHEHNVIHRDFKPGNVLVDRAGRVRVVDFGLAAAAENEGSLEGDDAIGETEETPLLEGTPLYMAPEQLFGCPATVASDQYAFCLSLRQALSREQVFTGSVQEQRKAKSCGPPRRWPKGSPGRSLQAIIDRGMDPDPARRWPTMRALRAALERARKPSRTPFVVAGLAVALVAGVAGAGDSACSDAAMSIRGTWNAAHRQRVLASLSEVDAFHAGDTAAHVTSALDDVAQRWATEHQAACALSRVAGEARSAQLTCLQRSRSALAELVHILQHADREVLDRAAMLAAKLPEPEDCMRTSRAESGPEEALEALADDFARAELELELGRFEAARATLREAQSKAPASTSTRAAAEISTLLGMTYAREGRFVEAESVLRESLDMALELGMLATAARACATLAYVLGVGLAQYREGLSYAEFGVALTNRADSNPRLRAEALVAHAMVLRHAAKLPESEERHRAALELRRATLPAEHPDIFASMSALGVVLTAQQRMAEAHDLLLGSLELRIRIQGEKHPDVAFARANLGHLLTELGQHDEARRMLVAAAEGAKQSLGVQHPSYAVMLQNLAAVEKHAGHVDSALSRLREAEQLSLASVGADHPSTAIMRGNIAHILMEQGDVAGAGVELERAMRVARVQLSPEDLRLVPLLSTYAAYHARLGRLEEAERLWEEAIEIRRNALGNEHPKVTQLREALNSALADAGQPPTGMSGVSGMRDRLGRRE